MWAKRCGRSWLYKVGTLSKTPAHLAFTILYKAGCTLCNLANKIWKSSICNVILKSAPLLHIFWIFHGLWFDMIYTQWDACFLSASFGEGIENTQVEYQKPWEILNHTFSTLYLLFLYFYIIWKIKSHNFTPWHFVNKLCKIDVNVCDITINNMGLVQGT
jgi:hypothetical protein